MYVVNRAHDMYHRPTILGKVVQLGRSAWSVVAGTDDDIIGSDQWERVQALRHKRTRQLSFGQNQSPFAGFLRCGDCGRAMVKTRRAGGIYSSCGSYKRYGPT